MSHWSEDWFDDHLDDDGEIDNSSDSDIQSGRSIINAKHSKHILNFKHNVESQR